MHRWHHATLGYLLYGTEDTLAQETRRLQNMLDKGCHYCQSPCERPSELLCPSFRRAHKWKPDPLGFTDNLIRTSPQYRTMTPEQIQADHDQSASLTDPSELQPSRPLLPLLRTPELPRPAPVNRSYLHFH